MFYQTSGLALFAVLFCSGASATLSPSPTPAHYDSMVPVSLQLRPKRQRTQTVQAPPGEISVEANADRPAGIAHSFLSARLPSQMACTAKGDVLAVVDTAPATESRIDSVPETREKIWRFAPTLGAHGINQVIEKYRPLTSLKLSPDGRYVAVAGKQKSALLDVDSGQEISGITPKDRLDAVSFSANGHFVTFPREGAGVVRFDSTAGKVEGITPGTTAPQWISDDGKLVLATQGKSGLGIFDGKGSALYPAARTDRPIAAVGAVTVSADGKRLAVLTEQGTPPRYSVILFAMPAMTRVGEFPAGDGKLAPLAMHLSPDGRLLAVLRSDSNDAFRTTFFEVESGMPIGDPSRLAGGPLGICGSGGRFLWHSWLLPQEKGTKSNGAVFRSDVVEPTSMLLGPTTAPADVATLLRHDATRAWGALAALKAKGETRASVEKAIAALPQTGLTEKDRAALPQLAKQLADPKTREATVAETKQLLSRITVADYQQHVGPVLRAANATELLDFWRDTNPARASSSALASRIALLPEN